MTLPQFASWFVGDRVPSAVRATVEDDFPNGHANPGRPRHTTTVPASVTSREAPTPADLADLALIARVGTGDHEALRVLHASVYPSLWDFAHTLVESRAAADDLVQDAFIVLWERASAWDPHAHVRGFLFTTVRHLARNAARRNLTARRSALTYQHDVTNAVMSVVPASPAERIEHRELVAAIGRAVAALEEPRRTALLLRWRDQLPYDEIARVLGVSVTAAQHLVVRARGVVRRQIAPLLGEG